MTTSPPTSLGEHGRALAPLLALLAAVAICVDAAMVGAPGLALLALPLLIGLAQHAWRRGRGLVAMVIGGLLHAGVSLNYALQGTGGEWPAGDVIGVLVGGPLAAATAVVAVQGLRHHAATPVTR